MTLTFYAHVFVFNANDELRTTQKGDKHKILTEGSTEFQ
jgi:hypothetical protein